MEYFDFRKIEKSNARIADIYRLRYKVYIEEWGFERPEDHPQGIETDAYDAKALHIGAIHRPSHEMIGTVRLISHSELGFPLVKNMCIERDVSPDVLQTTCEISRLAVSKNFRRRVGDNAIYNGEIFPRQHADNPDDDRRASENDIVMGIIRKVCEYSGLQGYTHWYVGMAKGLFILLKRRGLLFEPVGPEVDYHGLRRPYFGCVNDILKGNDELLSIYHGALALRARRSTALRKIRVAI